MSEKESNKQVDQVQDIIKRKEEIINAKNLSILHTYDTYKNESGRKDVSLCLDQSGDKIILRIGEVRPAGTFNSGYYGDNLIIPKLIEQNTISFPYELEEFVEGDLVSEKDTKSKTDGRINSTLLDKLIAVYWEFQQICKTLPLKQTNTLDKILNHLEKSEKLINDYQQVESIILNNRDFWDRGFPSKWKFSLDNLIITKNNKIGLIDNAGIGLRYFGYDLGWLIWPLWVTMKTDNYSKTDEHLEYLNYFCQKIAKTAPKDYAKIDINQSFWLMILERIIGMYYDLANNTKHLGKWSIGPNRDGNRTKKYLNFLRVLLDYSLQKLK